MEICPICLCNNDSECYETICKHNYHRRCITEWLKFSSTCPTCRKEIPINKLIFPNYNGRHSHEWQLEINNSFNTYINSTIRSYTGISTSPYNGISTRSYLGYHNDISNR